MIVLFYKLMDNIGIDDFEERRKHIIEKMLFASEIDNDSVNIYK